MTLASHSQRSRLELLVLRCLEPGWGAKRSRARGWSIPPSDGCGSFGTAELELAAEWIAGIAAVTHESASAMAVLPEVVWVSKLQALAATFTSHTLSRNAPLPLASNSSAPGRETYSEGVGPQRQCSRPRRTLHFALIRESYALAGCAI